MRVLLALDGSASSVHARDLVASLPWPEGTGITVLAAYELPGLWVGGVAMTGDWLTHTESELRSEQRDELTELAAPLENRGWSIDLRLVNGRPATVIKSVADELDADLIVLGSRGRGTMRAMLLGSVSAEVADQAHRSVLVVRSPKVTRLLVATDGSECASVIPDKLGKWGVFRDLPAVALSVAQVDSPAFELMVTLYTLGNEPLQEQREQLVENHREHADDMARQLGDLGLKAEPDVRSGDAAHQIVAAAAQRNADLIVTGSRCLHGLDRWLLGSVARNVVLHAEASVLIVRRRETPTG